MKPFLIWLVLALLGFGGLAGGYHGYLQDNPRRIAVVVDTSYDMTAVWPRVEPELTEIGAARYSAFSLVTDKRVIHGWQPRLRASLAEPYGPRDFAKLRELGIGAGDRRAPKRSISSPTRPPPTSRPLALGRLSLLRVSAVLRFSSRI